ncbi:hypothetical protein AB8O53_34710, partial [Streptomyces pilosus]
APGGAGVGGGGPGAAAPGGEPAAQPPGGHSGIRRVLAEARAYVDSPPPLGRVRSSFAPGGARTLRADGPGWSLVARTDDIAFVLLDDEPGEVLPVGRGPELPGLLAALARMAVRPLCAGAAIGGGMHGGRPRVLRPPGAGRRPEGRRPVDEGEAGPRRGARP